MALMYCGIDEAGYGPMLGPLCVGCAVFRVDRWQEGDEPPNLWELLSGAVGQRASDKKGRIAVNDSKKLKLSNKSVRKHPLTHLERGVMAFLGAACSKEQLQRIPGTDADLFDQLGCSRSELKWYNHNTTELPVGLSKDLLMIDANQLHGAMAQGGVGMERLACASLDERAFNTVVAKAGTKAAATGAGIVKHLRMVREIVDSANMDDAAPMPRVVCDRQSGRSRYRSLLSRAFVEDEVHVEHESSAASVYVVEPRNSGKPMRVSFVTEAEQQHLPVALASMTAKLVRELMMERFNRYWCGLVPELKPTAGYYQDATRWLADTREHIDNEVRQALVRIA